MHTHTLVDRHTHRCSPFVYVVAHISLAHAVSHFNLSIDKWSQLQTKLHYSLYHLFTLCLSDEIPIIYSNSMIVRTELAQIRTLSTEFRMILNGFINVFVSIITKLEMENWKAVCNIVYSVRFIYTCWSERVCNRRRLFSLLCICYAVSNVIRLVSAVAVCYAFAQSTQLSKAFNDNRQTSDRNI